MKIKTVHTHEYILLVNFLISLRKISSISQKDMAVTLNLKQTDISKIESKERRLDVYETFTWLNKCCPDNNDIILEVYRLFKESKSNERN